MVTASDTVLPANHIKNPVDSRLNEASDATISLKELSREETVDASTVLLKGNSLQKGDSKQHIRVPPLHLQRENQGLPTQLKKSRRGEYELTDAIQQMIDDGLKVNGLLTREGHHPSNPGNFLRLNFSYIDWV